MSAPRYDEIAVGDALPELVLPPVSRATLALFAGASGDHNPIHIDIDFAKKAGHDDVFAQGMLVMAWLGRALTGWVPQSAVRELGGRFVAMTRVGDRLTCGGKVVDKLDDRQVRVELYATDANGELKLGGYAVVALD